jgi:hypothetical protein
VSCKSREKRTDLIESSLGAYETWSFYDDYIMGRSLLRIRCIECMSATKHRGCDITLGPGRVYERCVNLQSSAKRTRLIHFSVLPAVKKRKLSENRSAPGQNQSVESHLFNVADYGKITNLHRTTPTKQSQQRVVEILADVQEFIDEMVIIERSTSVQGNMDFEARSTFQLVEVLMTLLQVSLFLNTTVDQNVLISQTAVASLSNSDTEKFRPRPASQRGFNDTTGYSGLHNMDEGEV